MCMCKGIIDISINIRDKGVLSINYKIRYFK